jgi:hypothetical protein
MLNDLIFTVSVCGRSKIFGKDHWKENVESLGSKQTGLGWGSTLAHVSIFARSRIKL